MRKLLRILIDAKGFAKPILGGTDLVIQIKEGIVKVNTLVDISNIPELDKIEAANGMVKIGAAVTHAKLCVWAKNRNAYGALFEASNSVGTPQVRNLASVVGNLCNAVPSADLAAPLLVLNTSVHITGMKGSRELPLEKFFIGPKKTVLNLGEIVTHIQCPVYKTGVSNYVKHGPRKASDLAIVGVAVYLDLDHNAKIRALKVALNAVAPTPILIPFTDEFIGELFSEKIAQKCADMAVCTSSPITDIRASADYRKEIVAVNVKKMFEKCANEQMR